MIEGSSVFTILGLEYTIYILEQSMFITLTYKQTRVLGWREALRMGLLHLIER